MGSISVLGSFGNRSGDTKIIAALPLQQFFCGIADEIEQGWAIGDVCSSHADTHATINFYFPTGSELGFYP